MITVASTIAQVMMAACCLSPLEMTSLQFWLLQKQMLMSTSTCLEAPRWSITSTACNRRGL